MNGFNSKRGWFTVVGNPDGSLAAVELTTIEAKLVRVMGGVLFDRAGFAEEVLKIHHYTARPKFMQFKKYRLLIPAKLCECQYTGWKPVYDP